MPDRRSQFIKLGGFLVGLETGCSLTDAGFGLQSAVAGETAREQLYLSWAPRLKTYFASHGVSDVEDLAQEVLFIGIAAMKRNALRNCDTLPGFIWIIAKRGLWQERARLACLRGIDAVREPASPFLDGEAVVGEREHREIAARVFRSMPAKRREVLVHFYVQGEPR